MAGAASPPPPADSSSRSVSREMPNCATHTSPSKATAIAAPGESATIRAVYPPTGRGSRAWMRSRTRRGTGAFRPWPGRGARREPIDRQLELARALRQKKQPVRGRATDPENARAIDERRWRTGRCSPSPRGRDATAVIEPGQTSDGRQPHGAIVGPCEAADPAERKAGIVAIVRRRGRRHRAASRRPGHSQSTVRRRTPPPRPTRRREQRFPGL